MSLRMVADPAEPFSKILAAEGFLASGRQGARTILMDLRPPLEQIRNGMKAHWRRELKVGDKNRLDIEEGSGDELFAQFIPMYREMVARKGFTEPNDIGQFRQIQKQLPANLKLKILLCKSGGVVCSGAICSAMGNSAVYLFGATSNAGLKSRGSYVLQWKAVEDFKRDGIAVYDLNGINPEANPGTYKFKSDLAGANGADVYLLGHFESHGSVLSRLCVQGWTLLKSKRRTLQAVARSVYAIQTLRTRSR
jgi:lipid II:glycine glycyltransferase (peptidoglycan interpeptide bridge formation enzyme)